MRIAIDVREACKPERTGKGQWTYALVDELLNREFPLVCYSQEPLPLSWLDRGATEILIPLSGLKWHVRVASLLQAKTDIDLYLSPTSYLVPYLLGKRFPYVPVVHDLIAFRREPHNRKARLIEHFTLQRTLEKAGHILTVSDATKHDLRQKFPQVPSERITPVFAGPMQQTVPLHTSDHQTILCIATLCPRKNQLRLIEAYAQLPPALRAQYRLVLAGARGWNDAPILELIERTPGVEWRQYVSDDEYLHLLGTCAVFSLPSLYEGFGMQILDALQRGIPVLTSDRGSLRELAGSAALIVDPEDTPSISRGLEQLLSNASLRETYRTVGPAQARRYSWQRTADLVLSAIEKVTGVAGLRE